jgi:uroporphyrinogen-III decarboxylase
MDPHMLKEKYGDKFIFWGGGVDTQQTLPYGTVDEVQTEVENRIKVFGKDGGFVFNTTHNIVAGTCIDNVIAMYETLNRIRGYPG